MPSLKVETLSNLSYPYIHYDQSIASHFMYFHATLIYNKGQNLCLCMTSQ